MNVFFVKVSRTDLKDDVEAEDLLLAELAFDCDASVLSCSQFLELSQLYCYKVADSHRCQLRCVADGFFQQLLRSAQDDIVAQGSIVLCIVLT